MYCRKSTESSERQALSLGAQERELNELAVKKNLYVVDTFRESKSARKPNLRKDFNTMIERIKNKEADGIICWKLNRLSRNWSDTGILLQLLSDGVIKEIVTSERSYDSETTNDIVLGVEFGESSEYSKKLSQDIKRGYREKISRGQWYGNAPHFYRNVGINKFNRTIRPIEDLRETFNRWVDYILLNKASLRQATQWLNKQDVHTKKGKPFQTSTVHMILSNPVYCGRFKKYPDRKGNWETLLTEEKFYRLQKILDIRRKPQSYRHEKGYRGLLLCEHCGCAITCTHKVKNGKDYIYYGCTKRRGKCPQPYITEIDLENQLFEHISQITLDQETLTQCKQIVMERNQDSLKVIDQQNINNSNQLIEVEQMISELVDMRLKNTISDETYRLKSNELENKREILSNPLPNNAIKEEEIISQTLKAFEICHRVEDLFNQGTITERAEIVDAIGWNLKMDNGVIRWNYRKPFDEMVMEENLDESPNKWRWRESNPRPNDTDIHILQA